MKIKINVKFEDSVTFSVEKSPDGDETLYVNSSLEDSQKITKIAQNNKGEWEIS